MLHLTVRTGYQQTVCVSLQCYFHLSDRQPNDLRLRTQGRETVAGSMKNVTFTVKCRVTFSCFAKLLLKEKLMLPHFLLRKRQHRVPRDPKVFVLISYY
jgi:hypothetical protein